MNCFDLTTDGIAPVCIVEIKGPSPISTLSIVSSVKRSFTSKVLVSVSPAISKVVWVAIWKLSKSGAVPPFEGGLGLDIVPFGWESSGVSLNRNVRAVGHLLTQHRRT